MSKFIGIRHEDKYVSERRSPLTPKHVERLVKQKKLDIIVQSSDRRIFQDEEYIEAGAKISKDLKKCSVIFGVKEIPLSFFDLNFQNWTAPKSPCGSVRISRQPQVG